MELDPSELENAAGGQCNERTVGESVMSGVTLGLGCALYACVSAANGYTGQEDKRDGRLCNDGPGSYDD